MSRALVTGSSTGIGFATAVALGRAGYEVVATMRRPERSPQLQELVTREELPVTILPHDDRVEVPEGIAPRLSEPGHPIAAGLPEEWPALLGYNRIVPKVGAVVVAAVGADPLLVAWEVGVGRAVAFASDCGPHWAPPAFVEWDGYARLWTQLVGWAARR